MITSEFTSRIRFIKKTTWKRRVSSGQNSLENSEIDEWSSIRKWNMAGCIFPNWPQVCPVLHVFLTMWPWHLSHWEDLDGTVSSSNEYRGCDAAWVRKVRQLLVCSWKHLHCNSELPCMLSDFTEATALRGSPD